MRIRGRWQLAAVTLVACLSSTVFASLGDRLPEFRDCVLTCQQVNCDPNDPTHIPLLHRALLWTCPSECDYVCQHIITNNRLTSAIPHTHPVVQFHGKWPFYRFLGMQEPFSVLFSLLNLAAHAWGLSYLREHLPPTYGLRSWYTAFGHVGYAAWTASAIFHTRDTTLTEKLDYFAAGGYVLFGLYLAPVRIFRLDDAARTPAKASVVRVWTALCLLLYAAHVAYLSLVRWDYAYNMAANIAVGLLQNVAWVAFSVYSYRRSAPPMSRTPSGVKLSREDKARLGRQRKETLWTAWPGMIVLTISVAMSLELLEFVPWRLMVDAHSLWHLGTAGPTVWWYLFLVKDAKEDMMNARLKA